MKPSLVIVVVCLMSSLAGCAEQRLAERRQEFADAKRACRASYPIVVGGMVTYETCVNQAGERLDGGGAANMLIRATRIELAEQIDSRKISMAEAGARFARVVYETTQESRRTDATNSAAAAALIGVMQRPQPQPYYPQPYVMKTPVQTMCNRTAATLRSSESAACLHRVWQHTRERRAVQAVAMGSKHDRDVGGHPWRLRLFPDDDQ
jgi:hypothetical protein